MILLSDRETGNRAPHVLAVFGVGLIGSAVVAQASAVRRLQEEYLPLSWTDGSLQTRQLADIQLRLATLLRELGLRGEADQIVELSVLWSAGKAGFSATHEETAHELANFAAVLRLTETIAASSPRTTVSFVHLSSAGGLFEGQRYVTSASQPAPRRPYGWLKWQQEQLLCRSPSPLRRLIYRPTSVYGYLRPGQRCGLIPTLIMNGLQQRVSYIVGRSSTLRDFVWIEDVARFLIRVLLEPDDRLTDSVAVIGCAKPTSIQEIQQLVQSALRRKLYVSFSPEAQNSEDITIGPGLLPSGLEASALALNIRRIYGDAVGRGLVFEPATE